MKKIQSIDIVTENCESYNIPANCINFINIEGFTDRFFLNYNDGRLLKWRRAYSVILKIKKSDEIKAHCDFSKPFFERIDTYADITSITFNYIDGKKFSFYVPWDYKGSHQNNSYQKVFIKNNIIIIDIRKKNKYKSSILLTF